MPVVSGQELYSVSPKDKLLRRIDPATGATISSVLITSAGDPFNGVKALAVSGNDVYVGGTFTAVGQ